MDRNDQLKHATLASTGALASFRGRHVALRLGLTMIVVGAAGVATAQTTGDAQPPPAASAADPATVQEIVVTATRRALNLQEVPATIQAVTRQRLEAFDLSGLHQLSAVVPGLEVAPSGGNNLYLRGVGSTSAGYNEAQVAVYIDGLYLPNPAMSIYSFNNIDQIEVLKGPQGTLYGRNATAGLIAVTTRDPGAELKADASVGYASYGTRTENLYLSAPLAENLAANIAIYDTKQEKGWSRNVFTGHDAQTNRETGVQAKLQWRPAIGTTVTGSFIYDTNDRSYGYGYQILPGTVGADGSTYLGKYRTASRIDPEAPFHAYLYSVKVQQDLGFANLMSLTGYQESAQKPLFPANNANLGQPLPGQGSVNFAFDETTRTWSQELQLSSKPSSSRFDWVAGLFYYHDKTKIAAASFTTCVATACATGAPPNIITGYPRAISYSGYVDGTYRLFDATRLTVGLRYTDETKRLSGRQVPLPGFPNSVATLPPTFVTFPGQAFPGAPNGIPTRLNFDKLTYRLVLAQDFGPNVHAYISDNLGFKSGAFNANLFTNPPVRPEILHAYEAGLKTELFDRKLRLNLAAFYYDYTDVQVRSTAPPAPAGSALLQNVAAEHLKGLDGDFTFVPTKGLSIYGGFEVLDGKYKDYPGTSCASVGPTRTVDGKLLGSVVSVPCNLAGFDVAFAVPLSATLGLSYDLETEYGVLTFNALDHYSSRFPLVADNSIKAPSTHIVDASVKWTSPDKRYDLQAYVRNLAKEYSYVNAAVAPGGFAIVPGAPRVFGITAGYHY
jgi:iron complex outermembrane receptor protein